MEVKNYAPQRHYALLALRVAAMLLRFEIFSGAKL
jgi:hypothetical protein